MTDSECIKFYNDNIKGMKMRMNKIQDIYPEFYKYVTNRFNDLNGEERISEIMYRIEHKLEEHPKCVICGTPLPFQVNKGIYTKNFCSKECEHSQQGIRISRNKCKQTKLDRYGDEYYNNRDKYKQTNLKRFGHENPNQNDEIKTKAKDTRLNTMRTKYGVDNIMHLPEYVDKVRDTVYKKYGVSHPMHLDKTKEKIRETLIKRYGVDHPMHYKPFIDKSFENKIKLHTHSNSSKLEKQILQHIKETYDKNVKSQYKTDIYPYHCDYYLPKYDLYIELRGTWTHGYHPYNPESFDDNVILNQWKEKVEAGHNYYQSAINTWTITDPKKRKIAFENKLNFIEIFSFSENEIKEQLKKFFEDVDK